MIETKEIFRGKVVSILVLLMSLFGFISNAQVGIGTTNPNATLDIRSTNQGMPANTDGILIPKIDNFPTVNPTTNQNGMLVFVTGNSIPNKGFYYWDNASTSWLLVAGIGNNGNTLDQAYDQGGLGLGKTINATDGAVRINGEDGILVSGTFGAGVTIDNEVTGPGTRMFFNPNKAAFRAGNINGNHWDNVNIGNYSIALGASNIASGTGSAALGLFTEASGVGSVAFGQNNVANQNYTTTFGQQNTASASNATAFGFGTIASGYSSTAFGDVTIASGINSTAFGLFTEASGTEATSFGFDTTASGIDATAFGYITMATGFASTGFGAFNSATADYSTAFGFFTTASGASSTAFGVGTIASGTNQNGPQNQNGIATAFGLGTSALGPISTAFGTNSSASGSVSTAFGQNTLASGDTSTAFGTGTVASAYNATAFGIDNTASGIMSTSFGQENEASGVASLAFGEYTQATEINSTAFGLQTLASGGSATAFGINTVASGAVSSAFGIGNVAPSSYETALGMYNTNYTPVVSGSGFSLQDRLFVVGNGTSDAARSNVLTIYKSGLININDAYDLPLTDGTANQVLTTDGAGLLSFQDINVNNTVYSLNQSYSLGGTGSGRIINAIYGPVEIQNNGGLIVSSFNQSHMLNVDGTNNRVGMATNMPTATLSVNGTANKPGGGTWAVFSDARLKENISNYNEGLNLITKVKPVNFSYNSRMSEVFGDNLSPNARIYQGVIAQELKKIAPDMVREVKLESGSFLEVDPNKFIYALINATREQQEMINNQDAEIEAQNIKIKHLESQLKKQQKDIQAIKALLKKS